MIKHPRLRVFLLTMLSTFVKDGVMEIVFFSMNGQVRMLTKTSPNVWIETVYEDTDGVIFTELVNIVSGGNFAINGHDKTKEAHFNLETDSKVIRVDAITTTSLVVRLE